MLRIKGDSEKEGNIDFIKAALQSDDTLYLQRKKRGAGLRRGTKRNLALSATSFSFKIYLQGDCTVILTVQLKINFKSKKR